MSISDELADTIAGEKQRWASLAGLDAPLPEVAENGNLWGFISLALGLAVMAGAFAVRPWFIKGLVVVGLVVMVWRIQRLRIAVTSGTIIRK